MVWDEIAKGAFLTLCEYCRRVSGKCEKDCIFYNDEVGCIFGSGDLPEMWELPVKED